MTASIHHLPPPTREVIPLHRGVARIPEHHIEEYFGVPDDRQLEVTPPPTRRDALLIFGGALAAVIVGVIVGLCQNGGVW